MPVLPKTKRTLPNATMPVNSKGNQFATVQAAITDLAGDGWVYVPTGTFNEALTITDDNVELFGAGWSSIIDGGATGHAINISGNNCVIRDLTVKTNAGGGNNYAGIYCTGHELRVIKVYVNGSDYAGIMLLGARGNITLCLIVGTDDYGIYIGSVSVIHGNIFRNNSGYGILIDGSGDNTIVNTNFIDTVASDGVYIDTNGENCVVVGNRIMNVTGTPINDNSGTSTVGNNDIT